MDLVDTIREKLQEAIADQSSRNGALVEAAGAARTLNIRLRKEDQDLFARWMLVFGDQLHADLESMRKLGSELINCSAEARQS